MRDRRDLYLYTRFKQRYANVKTYTALKKKNTV